MDETKVMNPEEKKVAEIEALKKRLKEENDKILQAGEVMKTGKGVLNLEKPIMARSKNVDKLPYDFTTITGMEYVDAMDRGKDGQQVISNNQCLNLFAVAAAKMNEDIDRVDVVTQIGMTDAVAAVEAARVFFLASMRAGRMRISKE